jgi:hypothetical protein
MTTISTFRKRPVEVQALRWTGGNEVEVAAFTGARFEALDEADRANCDDPEATAQVFDVLHATWVLVYDGDWIIRGLKGEFYPCRDEVFTQSYERVQS